MAWPLLQKHVEMGSFYCDRRPPCQKGTNENTNGRIRRCSSRLKIIRSLDKTVLGDDVIIPVIRSPGVLRLPRR